MQRSEEENIPLGHSRSHMKKLLSQKASPKVRSSTNLCKEESQNYSADQ